MSEIHQNLKFPSQKGLAQVDVRDAYTPGHKEVKYPHDETMRPLFLHRPLRLCNVIPGLEQAARNAQVIDLTVFGAQVPSEDDGILNVITTVLNPDYPRDGIRTLPKKQHYIMLRNILPLIRDYRGTIQSAFEHLRVGGWLVVTVPHQFLAERKFRLPSRYGNRVARYYTPATLIGEIEEALDPTEYRLRLLCDDDTGYDYSTDINEQSTGNQRIVVAVERIKRPFWADQLTVGDDPTEDYDATSRVVSKEESPAKTTIVAPATGAIESILVIKLDHRGDYLMAIPAFSELRQRFPQARITLICGSWNADTAQQSGCFDEILPFNFFAEDASLQQEPKRSHVNAVFAKLVQDRAFDLAIDMRFFDDTRDLLRRVEARFKAGFDRWNVFPWLDIPLTLPSPTLDGNAEQYNWSADVFCKKKQVSGTIHSITPTKLFRKAGIAIYGPYKPLKVGHYSLELNLRCVRYQQVLVDVIYAEATEKLFSGHVMVGPNSCESIEFSLLENAHDVEIRINEPSWTGKPLTFSGVKLVRKGAVIGVHQRESMFLLVQLISIRLNAPYNTEIAEI